MSSFTSLFPVSFSSHPLEPGNEHASFFQKATDILFGKVLLRRLPSSKVVSVPCDLFVQRPISVRALREVTIEGPALLSSKGN